MGPLRLRLAPLPQDVAGKAANSPPVSGMAAGHREAARGVVDGGEHGARLEQDGPRDGGPTMRDTALLQPALGLTPPWTVGRADFDAQAHRLDIQIDFAPGSRF